jgi:hypothetical protein
MSLFRNKVSIDEVGYSLKSKHFFDLPQYSMNIATILDDDVTVGVSYLEVIG